MNITRIPPASPSNKTYTKKASTSQYVLYHISFVLIYVVLYFLATLYLMNYDEKYGTEDWVSEATIIEKINYTIVIVLQFPFAKLISLLTNNGIAWIVGIIINSQLLAWLIKTFLIGNKRKFLKRATFINLVLFVVIVFTIIFKIY